VMTGVLWRYPGGAAAPLRPYHTLSVKSALPSGRGPRELGGGFDGSPTAGRSSCSGRRFVDHGRATTVDGAPSARTRRGSIAPWASSCRCHPPATPTHASRTPLPMWRCLLPRWLTLPVRCSRVAGTLQRGCGRQEWMSSEAAAQTCSPPRLVLADAPASTSRRFDGGVDGSPTAGRSSCSGRRFVDHGRATTVDGAPSARTRRGSIAPWASSCRCHPPATLTHASRTPLPMWRCLLPRWLTLPVRCSRVAGTLQRGRGRQELVRDESAAMRDAIGHRYGVRQAGEPCVVIFALLGAAWDLTLFLRWCSCTELLCKQLCTKGLLACWRWSSRPPNAGPSKRGVRRSFGRASS
jgi:hypothetical protein